MLQVIAHGVFALLGCLSKKERIRLLDEAQAITALHRKSLRNSLKGELARKRRTSQRKKYGHAVDVSILIITRRR
jgi:hypothetical protein